MYHAAYSNPTLHTKYFDYDDYLLYADEKQQFSIEAIHREVATVVNDVEDRRFEQQSSKVSKRSCKCWKRHCSRLPGERHLIEGRNVCHKEGSK